MSCIFDSTDDFYEAQTKISTDADVKSVELKISISHKVNNVLTWNLEYIFIIIYFILRTQKFVVWNPILIILKSRLCLQKH